jgi:hypothetical protein
MRATTLGTTTADPTAHAPRDLSAGTRAMTTTTALGMAQGDNDDESFMKWARAARYATDADEVVELPRPLGLILNQDPATGNVYVEKVAPRGNAARSGKVGLVGVSCGMVPYHSLPWLGCFVSSLVVVAARIQLNLVILVILVIFLILVVLANAYRIPSHTHTGPRGRHCHHVLGYVRRRNVVVSRRRSHEGLGCHQS